MGTQPPWHSHICPSGCWVLCCSAPSPRRRKKRRWLGSVPGSWGLSPWGVCMKDILQHRWRQDLIGGLCTAALHLRRRVFQLLWEVALKSKAFSFPFLQQKASSYRTCLQGCRYQRCWGNLPKNSTIRTLAASQSHKAGSMEGNTAALWSTEDKRLLFSRLGTDVCSLKVRAKVSQASRNKPFSEEMQLDWSGVNGVFNHWIPILIQHEQPWEPTTGVRCEWNAICDCFALVTDGYGEGSAWSFESFSTAVNYRPYFNTF